MLASYIQVQLSKHGDLVSKKYSQNFALKHGLKNNPLQALPLLPCGCILLLVQIRLAAVTFKQSLCYIVLAGFIRLCLLLRLSYELLCLVSVSSFAPCTQFQKAKLLS